VSTELMQTSQAVIEALARAPEIVVPLVREVPPAILKRRPAPRRWSAHEHACHLAHVHALFFDRLETMLREPEPLIAGYQPGDQDVDDMLLRMDLDESLDRYVADRDRLVARLRALDASDWARTARHSEYRAYSVFIMFRHVALHDFLHGYRIEELLLRPDWEPSAETSAPLA
jgi:DinB superfamily